MIKKKGQHEYNVMNLEFLINIDLRNDSNPNRHKTFLNIDFGWFYNLCKRNSAQLNEN